MRAAIFWLLGSSIGTTIIIGGSYWMNQSYNGRGTLFIPLIAGFVVGHYIINLGNQQTEKGCEIDENK